MEPHSPPPAAAPPAPPTTETESLLGPVSYGSSYQQDEQLRDQLQGNGSAYTPAITNYNQNAVYSSFGDVNLRPNIGEDNWFDGEILGLALTEILKILQWSNIISCSLIIVLEVLVAIFRIFAPARFVLGCYLAFTASLLLRVEIAQIIKQHKDHMGLGDINNTDNNGQDDKPQDLKWISGIGSHSKIPDVKAPALRDNFGLLFHPSGKACILLLMASMCVGQHNNIIELLLGFVFLVNAFLIVYILCRYPGYRQSEDIPIPTLPPEPGSQQQGPVTPSAAAWTYYENDASSLWKVTSTIAEGSSLLTSAKNSFQ